MLNVLAEMAYGTNNSYVPSMSQTDFAPFAHDAVTLAVNLLVQTTLVLAIGLFAAWAIRRRGAALQSSVLRTTLLATLVCPITSWLLYTAGVSGFRIELRSLESEKESLTVATAVVEQPLQSSDGRPVPDANRNVIDFDADPMIHSPMNSSGPFQVPELASISRPVDEPEPVVETSEAEQLQTPPMESSTEPKSSRAPLLYKVVCVFWFCVSGMFLFRLLVANLLMERLRRRSQLAPEGVINECHDIARKMLVVAPPVLMNDRLSSPCLLGVMRPAVMIPSNWHPISADVLAHELAHLRRNDCVWSLLGHLATALLPWQPLVWLLSRRMEQAADNVCDDYVVAHRFDRVSYARELVTIAERFPASWSAMTAAVGIAEFQSCLGSRVQRILDCSRTLSLRTGWKNLILVIAAAATGTVLAGLLGTARNEIPPNRDDANNLQIAKPDVTRENQADVRNNTLVTGTVLKPDGTPAAGAAIRVGAPIFVLNESTPDQRPAVPLNETTADENGHFEILVRQELTDHESSNNQPPLKSTPVTASLKGFGPFWLDLEEVESNKPMTLQLVEDHVVRGQVVDLEGNPIRGANVTINRVDRLEDEDLTMFLSTINSGMIGMVFGQPFRARKSIGIHEINASLIGLPEKVTTDQEGRLEIRGMGKDRLVHLALDGGNFAYRIATVVSRKMETIHPVGRQLRQSISEPIYGAEFKIAVPPSRPVEGTVVDASNGEPLAGVTVAVERHFEMEIVHPIKTKSDSNGRFRLMGLVKKGDNELKIIPNDDQPYFRRTISVPDSPGYDPIEMKISLHRGLWIKGRVTNKQTHEPVTGIHLHYYPLISNEFAERLPKSDQDGDLDKDGHRFQSDQDGLYRLLGLPGPALVGAENEFMLFRRGVGLDEITAPRDQESNEILVWGEMNGPRLKRSNSIREINPNVDAQEVRLDMELDPGFSIKIRLIDEQGLPVKGAEVSGTRWREKTDEPDDGVRIVHNLGPDEKRVVYASHRDRNLGLIIPLEPPYEAGREATVVLKPLARITGRLLDAGEPMNAITVDALYQQPDKVFLQILGATSSDADGRFQLSVIPGHAYELHMHWGSDANFYAQVKEPMTFTPGETRDLGDLTLGNDRKFHPVKVEETNKGDIKTSDDSQLEFTGLVVDPDDKPVANAKILAVVWRRGALPDPDAKPLAITDQNGRFQWTISQMEYGRLWKGGYLVAIADGYGFAAMNPAILETTGKLKAGLKPEQQKFIETLMNESKPVLHLVRDDVPLTGRIIDAEGQPVAGARARVAEVWWNAKEGLDGWQKATAEKQADYYSLRNQTPSGMNGPQLPLVIQDVLSNDDGRFTLRGIGCERIVKMVITGPGIELAEFHARTRMGETIIVPNQWDSGSNRTEKYCGADFVHVGAVSVPVVGQITDIDTGKGIEGVRVGDGFEGFTTMRGSRYLYAITDAQGRYRLEGLAVNKRHVILVFPPTESFYLPGKDDVSTKPGQIDVVKDFQLRSGVALKGRAVDARTGEAIPGHVTYYSFISNEHLKNFPGFTTLGAPHQRGTDDDGKFTIPVIPGTGILTFDPTDHRKYSRGQGADSIKEFSEKPVSNRLYMTAPNILIAVNTVALQKVEAPEGVNSVEANFQIQAGVDVIGKLIDPSGNPVSGAIATGEDGFGGGWYSLEDAAFRAQAFYPESPRTLGFYHPERELGAVFKLDKIPAEPLTITLHPSGGVRGRLIDEKGVPLSHFLLSGDTIPDQRWSNNHLRLATDQEGRFEIRGLIPGREYTVSGRSKEKVDRRILSGIVLKAITIDSAEVKDVGDVKLQPAMKD